MKYFCSHSTSCWIEADAPEDAQVQLCQLIRALIEPSHIQVDANPEPCCADCGADLDNEGECKDECGRSSYQISTRVRT